MSIILSKRLEMIASFIPKGVRFADIGSDHAYIPCVICTNDPIAQAIAGEVRKGPFQSATKTVQAYGLENQVDVRLGDGLEVIEDHDAVSHIIIAGMGGSLIASILEQGKDKLGSVNTLILQPNVGSNNVRKWTNENGFEITEEHMIEDNGHIYEIIVAKRNEEKIERLHEKELYFGPKLLLAKPTLFYKKWTNEKKHLEEIIKGIMRSKHPNQKQLQAFQKQIDWIKEEIAND